MVKKSFSTKEFLFFQYHTFLSRQRNNPPTDVLHLQVLQIWSLLVDDLSQELVLQSIPGHREVNKGGLGLNLWLVVRIGQFSVKDEPEARVEEALFVPDLYVTAGVEAEHV